MMKTLIVAVGLLVAWLTRQERNPIRWPAVVRDEAIEVVKDAREAIEDGARAGKRTEAAFDRELAEVRANARRW